MKIIGEVTGAQLVPGMLITKDTSSKPHTVPKLSGKCEKGLHFGQGCYDRIGRWLEVKP